MPTKGSPSKQASSRGDQQSSRPALGSPPTKQQSSRGEPISSRPSSASPPSKKKSKKKKSKKKTLAGGGAADSDAAMLDDEEDEGEDGDQEVTAAQHLEEAYAACVTDSFELAIELLSLVHEQDQDFDEFEAKALPGLLLLPPASQRGSTMLHWAAHHGNIDAVRELLRLGASPQLQNAHGQSSIDVAAANQHVPIVEMLRAHASAWSGWGITELSCLACLYDESRFRDCEAYLVRMIERDRARCGPAGTASSIFRQPLPSGIRMVDIAARMSTSGTGLLRDRYAELRIGQEGGEEGGAAAEAMAVAQGAADEGVAASAAAAEAAAPAVEAAAEAETAKVREEAMGKAMGQAMGQAMGEATTEAAEEGEQVAVEWPDDGWEPPCAGYMVCALCKGRSGGNGRWGAGGALHPSSVRCPLAICLPCQRLHGLPAAGDGSASEEGSSRWINDTLLVNARQGKWDSHVVQMVHPIFGEIGR